MDWENHHYKAPSMVGLHYQPGNAKEHVAREIACHGQKTEI